MSEETPSVGSAGAAGPSSRSEREVLSIDIDAEGAALRVAVHGELDESTAPGLVARIEAEAVPGHDVVLDLGGLTFCGSAGLSALVLIERHVAAGGGALTVAHPTPFLVQLLEMAGLDALIAAPER